MAVNLGVIKWEFQSLLGETVYWNVNSFTDSDGDGDDYKLDHDGAGAISDEIVNIYYDFDQVRSEDNLIEIISAHLSYWIKSHLTLENLSHMKTAAKHRFNFPSKIEREYYEQLTQAIEEILTNFICGISSKVENFVCFSGIRDRNQFQNILKLELKNARDDLECLEDDLKRNIFARIFASLVELGFKRIVDVFIEDNGNIIENEKKIGSFVVNTISHSLREGAFETIQSKKQLKQVLLKSAESTMEFGEKISEVTSQTLKHLEEKLSGIHEEIQKTPSLEENWTTASECDSEMDDEHSANAAPQFDLDPQQDEIDHEQHARDLKQWLDHLPANSTDFDSEYSELEQSEKLPLLLPQQQQQSSPSRLVLHLNLRSQQISIATEENGCSGKWSQETIQGQVAQSKFNQAFYIGEDANRLRKSNSRDKFDIWSIHDLLCGFHEILSRDDVRWGALEALVKLIMMKCSQKKQIIITGICAIIPDWIGNGSKMFLEAVLEENVKDFIVISESQPVAAAYLEKFLVQSCSTREAFAPLLVVTECCDFVQMKIIAVSVNVNVDEVWVCAERCLAYANNHPTLQRGDESPVLKWELNRISKVYKARQANFSPGGNWQILKEVRSRVFQEYEKFCVHMGLESWINRKLEAIVISEDEIWQEQIKEVLKHCTSKVVADEIYWKELLIHGAGIFSLVEDPLAKWFSVQQVQKKPVEDQSQIGNMARSRELQLQTFHPENTASLIYNNHTRAHFELRQTLLQATNKLAQFLEQNQANINSSQHKNASDIISNSLFAVYNSKSSYELNENLAFVRAQKYKLKSRLTNQDEGFSSFV